MYAYFADTTVLNLVISPRAKGGQLSLQSYDPQQIILTHTKIVGMKVFDKEHALACILNE